MTEMAVAALFSDETARSWSRSSSWPVLAWAEAQSGEFSVQKEIQVASPGSMIRLKSAWAGRRRKGGSQPAVVVVTTGLDHAAAGFAGTCLIAYMSSLTTRGFTATQYALLSSLFTLPGRLLASQSGRIVEATAQAAEAGGALAPLAAVFSGLPAGSYGLAASPAALGAGYLVFFFYSASLGTAALVLTVRMARRGGRTNWPKFRD